jgi:hypothetical protein
MVLPLCARYEIRKRRVAKDVQSVSLTVYQTNSFLSTAMNADHM